MRKSTVSAVVVSRRRLLAAIAALSTLAIRPLTFPVAAAEVLQPPFTVRSKPIPATGEQLPVIGMGTWKTFNIGRSDRLQRGRNQVLNTFFSMGGGMIDSSPMYGSAEAVIGRGLARLGAQPGLFSATKVWTPFALYGKVQVENSFELWGLERFDLMQIHNLLNWQAHLETLLEMKAQGRIRYIGVTTSHGRRHEPLEQIMQQQPIDFVQLTYNVLDREAEKRLLPLARERGIALIANRPFQGGRLFDRFQKYPLPDWVSEFDCDNWAQFFLKFIISHPAVTVAIPATHQVPHMVENMGALRGRLPDAAMRQRMIHYIASL